MTTPFDHVPPPAAKAERASALMRYLSRFDDGEVMRWSFRGLVIGAMGVLALDLQQLSSTQGWSLTDPAAPLTMQPVLPPAVEIGEPLAPTNDPRPFLTTDGSVLGQPMSFTLKAEGRLLATGTIQPGTAAALADELDARGEYVRVVSLDSPGGALEDAMEMAKLLRQRGLDAEVPDGALCASSCPLVLAGGVRRSVGEKAAVGVHQFYAAIAPEMGAAQVMADAQATTARISRHLASMGVDAALWLHALDTPPRALYYLSPDEMARYRLVGGEEQASASGDAAIR